MLLICLVFCVMPFCWSSFCVSCQMLPMSMDSPLLIAPSDFSCVYLYLKAKNMHRLYWFDFFIYKWYWWLQNYYMYYGPLWSCDRMIVWFTTICNQCLSPLKLWVRSPFMSRCTRYTIMWYSLSVTCYRSVIFSGYPGFLHQYIWPPWYNWNIVESGIKYHKQTNYVYLRIHWYFTCVD